MKYVNRIGRVSLIPGMAFICLFIILCMPAFGGDGDKTGDCGSFFQRQMNRLLLPRQQWRQLRRL